jgi:hypothetical protein
MSTLSVSSTWDIAKARNEARKVVLGQNYPPVVCARAVAVVAALGELILSSGMTGTLEISIVPRNGKQSVELICKIPQMEREHLSLETVQSQLARAADGVEMHEYHNQLDITVYLWPDKNM